MRKKQSITENKEAKCSLYIWITFITFKKSAISPATSQRYLKFNTPKTKVMAISHPQTTDFYLLYQWHYHPSKSKIQNTWVTLPFILNPFPNNIGFIYKTYLEFFPFYLSLVPLFIVSFSLVFVSLFHHLPRDRTENAIRLPTTPTKIGRFSC